MMSPGTTDWNNYRWLLRMNPRAAIYDYLIDFCNVPASYLEQLNGRSLHSVYAEAKYIAAYNGELETLENYITN
jgi:hypothetical protein